MTPKQQRFVDEYMIDLNATQAATRAGYSKKTAEQQGSRLLSNVKVARGIAEAVAARSERTKIDADWVLRRLVEIDRTNMADFLVIPKGGGRPCFDLSAATPEQLAAIEGLQLDTHREKGEDGGTVEKIKLTLPGRLKTLELIGKHVDVQAFAERQAALDSQPAATAAPDDVVSKWSAVKAEVEAAWKQSASRKEPKNAGNGTAGNNGPTADTRH